MKLANIFVFGVSSDNDMSLEDNELIKLDTGRTMICSKSTKPQHMESLSIDYERIIVN